jgi:hypothetical protein
VFGEVNLPLIQDLEVNSLPVTTTTATSATPPIRNWACATSRPSSAAARLGLDRLPRPDLFEKNAPLSKNDTNNSYNDPILCPGGVLSSNPIANPLRDCDLQQFKLQGGNANLSLEKSKTFSFGVVLEPIASHAGGRLLEHQAEGQDQRAAGRSHLRRLREIQGALPAQRRRFAVRDPGLEGKPGQGQHRRRRCQPDPAFGATQAATSR